LGDGPEVDEKLPGGGEDLTDGFGLPVLLEFDEEGEQRNKGTEQRNKGTEQRSGPGSDALSLGVLGPPGALEPWCNDSPIYGRTRRSSHSQTALTVRPSLARRNKGTE
jgi:hypothetical protein